MLRRRRRRFLALHIEPIKKTFLRLVVNCDLARIDSNNPTVPFVFLKGLNWTMVFYKQFYLISILLESTILKKDQSCLDEAGFVLYDSLSAACAVPTPGGGAQSSIWSSVYSIFTKSASKPSFGSIESDGVIKLEHARQHKWHE